jgi:hypothetical protein
VRGLRLRTANECTFVRIPSDSGIAIELDEKTSISWDGRDVFHATAVPEHTPGLKLFSLWTALTSDVANSAKANEKLRRLIAARQGPPSYKLGDRVYARWFAEKDRQQEFKGRWFAAEGTVVSLESDAVTVKFRSGEYEMEYSRANAAQHVCVCPPESDVCRSREGV